MDFATTRQEQAKRLFGLSTAALLHVVMIYGLVTGTAQRLVTLIQAPIEANLIEAPPAPPPPPLEVIPPPQLKAPPPPSYIAPPEIKLSAPPPVNAIMAVSTQPPETPVAFAPTPPPTPELAPSTPPTVAAHPVNQVGVVCANYEGVKEGLGDRFAAVADAEGIRSAEVVLLLTLGPNGETRQVQIKSASNAATARLAAKAVPRLQCKAQGHVVQLQVPFSFKLVDD